MFKKAEIEIHELKLNDIIVTSELDWGDGGDGDDISSVTEQKIGTAKGGSGGYAGYSGGNKGGKGEGWIEWELQDGSLGGDAFIMIYRGNTNLIHDYHQTKVTDPKAYGKAFGKALFVFGLAPLFSGLVALAGDSKPIVITAIAVLVAIFCIGFICLWRGFGC